jgi:putative ABC transport system permease protein
MSSSSPFLRLGEPFRSALQSIWAHRVRSALTVLGIVIGVASVVAVVQVGKALEGRVMADIDSQTSHTFFLASGMSNEAWRTGAKVRYQNMTVASVVELRELVPEIRVTSPSYQLWSNRCVVKYRDFSRRIQVWGVDEQHHDLYGLRVAAGRSFTLAERLMKAPVVVLGSKLADDMGFTPEGAIGRSFTLGGMTAEVVGVLEPKGELSLMPTDAEDADWSEDGRLYIPIGAFSGLMPFFRPTDDMDWRLQVDGRLPLVEAEERLKTAMRRVRGLKAGDTDNFTLTSSRKQKDQAEKVSRSLMLASSAMVGISLLVGGIGVMNIMLVSVTERTREIGVRRALGARRRTILVQFLIEAILLCAVGGALGLFLGAILGTLASSLLMKFQAGIPLWALVSAFAVPALVGVLFGYYPARKAAHLDPIESLRYE